MRPIIIILCTLFISQIQAQYDFRTVPRKAGDQFFYFANRALDDGTYVGIGILDSDSLGTSEVIFVKWNCLGQVEWAKTLGGSITVNNTRGGIVQAENGDIVLAYNLATSWTSATMLVARYTLDGDQVWSKRLGINEEYARDIVATPDGGFVVAGSTGLYGNDRLRSDIYLIKLDADGNILWSRTYGNDDAFDDAFNISLSSENELLVTGRYIVGGTFYCFFLKADENGEPIIFKGYGQPKHRTYSFDIRETPEGDYLISGFTTIAKVDHLSNGDAFLLKLDENGELIFAHIYEPREDDRNDFGFSIVFEDDGDYGLALESSSFQAISGPQAPNKNVIFSLTDQGFIKDVQLFNPKGSQYTTMTKAPDGGYFLTGFSTYYLNNATFEGFAFKTDPDYNSGDNCEYYDRSDLVSTLSLPWDVQDISWIEAEGHRSVDHNLVGDYEFDEDYFLCFRYPEFDSEIVLDETTYCQGENIALSTLNEGLVNSWTWEVNDETYMGEEVNTGIDSVGTYVIRMTATDGCQTIEDSVEVTIVEGNITEISRQLCPGDSLIFMDSTLVAPGSYRFVSGSSGSCDSVFVVTISPIVVDTFDVGLTLCPGKEVIFGGDTLTGAGEYVINFNTGLACDSIVRFTVTEGMQDTLDELVAGCPGTPVEAYGRTFDQLDTTYVVTVTGPYCDTIVHLTIEESDDCPCDGFFPDAFTPNGDGMNDTYGMFEIEDGCSPLDVEDFEMHIFNRWGQKIFSTRDVEEKWNGTFEGEEAPSEVYLMTYSYKLRETTKNGSRDVTLIR